MAILRDLLPSRFAIPVVVLLAVVGCAGGDPYAIDDPLRLKRMSLIMETGANDNRPVRVELVRVDDQRLVDQLVATDTTAWFGGVGEAFHRANPEAVFNAWELVPGHNTGSVDVRTPGKLGGVLFCDAPSGAAPFRLRPDVDLTVAIDDGGCRIDGGAPRRRFFRAWRRHKDVELSFVVDGSANGRRPLRVQLVRVDDADLVGDLARLSGAAWFGPGGKAFRRAHPGVMVDDWELVPGRDHGPYPLDVNRKVNGMLYCGSTRKAPLELRWRRRLTVEIDGEACRLVPHKRQPRRGERP